jgi:hypothetical protein
LDFSLLKIAEGHFCMNRRRSSSFSTTTCPCAFLEVVGVREVSGHDLRDIVDPLPAHVATKSPSGSHSPHQLELE